MTHLRRGLFWMAIALAIAALGVSSGLVPITASSGHWRVTYELLDFAKRRSVATHAVGIDAPPLDAPALVVQGAGHYEIGCRSCHGVPGGAMPVVPARMTPHPPPLREFVGRWSPAELFYIVKHGIKFTGMPAWPAAGRDDEVWAVVAFLLRLPELDRSAYDALVFGPRGDTRPTSAASNDVEALARARCASCHGAEGLGRDVASAPRLAGQREEYLRRALLAYATGERKSGTMGPIASALSSDDVPGLAAHYATRSPLRPQAPAGSESTPATTSTRVSAASAPAAGSAHARGQEIAYRGIPDRRVPACIECHGPISRDRNPAYPVLAGQFREYLTLQLRLFARNARGGSDYAHLMLDVAPHLTSEEIEAVAAYFASLSGTSLAPFPMEGEINADQRQQPEPRQP